MALSAQLIERAVHGRDHAGRHPPPDHPGWQLRNMLRVLQQEMPWKSVFDDSTFSAMHPIGEYQIHLRSGHRYEK